MQGEDEGVGGTGALIHSQELSKISYFKLQEIGIQLLQSTKAIQQTVPKLESTR